MAAFDFVECSVKGYQFVWSERRLLARMAVIPLGIKMGIYAFVILMGWEENFLRQGLLLLPAYFAEGWLLVTVLHYALLPAESRNTPSSSRNMRAGIAVYVLTQLVTTFLAALVLSGEVARTEVPLPEARFQTFAIALAALFFLVWSFRLLWLYIPVALGYSVRHFLYRIRAYNTSFYMMGTWLICFVPSALLLLIISQILMTLFPAQGAVPSLSYSLAMMSAQTVVELGVVLVVTVAMAYGIRAMVENDKP